MAYSIIPALPIVSAEELAKRTDASRNAARDALRRAYYEGK